MKASILVIGLTLTISACSHHSKTEYQRTLDFCKGSVSVSNRHNKYAAGHHDSQGNLIEMGDVPATGNQHSSLKDCMGESWKEKP